CARRRVASASTSIAWKGSTALRRETFIFAPVLDIAWGDRASSMPYALAARKACSQSRDDRIFAVFAVSFATTAPYGGRDAPKGATDNGRGIRLTAPRGQDVSHQSQIVRCRARTRRRRLPAASGAGA